MLYVEKTKTGKRGLLKIMIVRLSLVGFEAFILYAAFGIVQTIDQATSSSLFPAAVPTSVTRLGYFCTLGIHLKPMATIILPKSPT